MRAQALFPEPGLETGFLRETVADDTSSFA